MSKPSGCCNDSLSSSGVKVNCRNPHLCHVGSRWIEPSLVLESEDDTVDRLSTDMEDTNYLLRVVDRVSDESRSGIEQEGTTEFVKRMRVFSRRLS